MKLSEQLERQHKAFKHGRQTKFSREKYDILQQIERDGIGVLPAGRTLWDALQLAYNHGYSAGFKMGLKDGLYDENGRQIREVTQAELDWTH